MAIAQKRDMARDAQLAHEKEWGGYNDCPPNVRQITEKEFVQGKFFRYDPDLYEFRQVVRGPVVEYHGTAVALRLYFFYDGTGVALSDDYWKGTVTYWEFYRCKHDFLELTQMEARSKGHDHFGMCYHVYECKKCGFVEAHDSSD